jgi:lipopolysaccharide/colanic/teichoic acid biosynthesis glycosyltransferase
MSGLGSEAPSERNLEARLLRIADVLIAAALLVLTLPLMMFVGLAIKLEGSGPVLSRQPRTGRDGRQFTVLRFRTTAHVAEYAYGPIWHRSAREMPISAFLHYTGIVDLPQLVNVLRGDMSLVGKFPKMSSVSKWAAWVLVALLSGALFRSAGSVLEFLE